MSLQAKFTRHPAAVGETYGQHLVTAMGFSLALARAAFFCAVHAFLPFLFEKAGSASIAELYERMVLHRGPHCEPAVSGAKTDAVTRHS